MRYELLFLLLALVSCRSTKKMEESTDVVSVADVRFLDSIKTSVSLSFDELDAWVVKDPPQPSLKGGVSHLIIRNGVLKKEQEQTTTTVRQDSSRIVNHESLKETHAPP